MKLDEFKRGGGSTVRMFPSKSYFLYFNFFSHIAFAYTSLSRTDNPVPFVSGCTHIILSLKKIFPNKKNTDHAT